MKERGRTNAEIQCSWIYCTYNSAKMLRHFTVASVLLGVKSVWLSSAV
jgi:hypothetical protein